MMDGHEKSDPAIVAVKPANKANEPTVEASAEANAAELAEPRAGTKGNAEQQSTCRTQSRVSVEQALERIRKVARERKKERFTALLPTRRMRPACCARRERPCGRRATKQRDELASFQITALHMPAASQVCDSITD
jgi:hypothetical protein